MQQDAPEISERQHPPGTPISSSHAEKIADVARAARRASRKIAKVSAEQRSQALRDIASAVRDCSAAILDANASDVQAADSRQLSPAMRDRLRLDEQRITDMATAVDEIAEMPDLVGQVVDQWAREDSLTISKVRIPLGVVAMIYESRPNVTTDAAALCIRSGNAVILRGGSESFCSNQALAKAVSAGLTSSGLDADTVQVVGTTERSAMIDLLQHEDDIDLVIPRGGEGLIRFVSEHSRIPVLKHYKGVCHLYVHAKANLDMALALAENGKVQRPGVCNAVETILVDQAVAAEFVPRLSTRFDELGVEMRGDATAQSLAAMKPASEEDWGAEYLDKIVAIRIVPDLQAAVGHIERYGSNHTEAIVTEDAEAAEAFVRMVNSSTVLVNASTRFADGGQLGLGAEIGISTTKLHAYGPMGAEGLTTTQFVVRGSGQVRT